MDEEELLRRYHADSQFSFGGLDKVKDSVDIKTDVLKDVLSKSNIYTEFREFKKPKYGLNIKRRAYSIGAFYDVSAESFGLQFNIFNFDYSGKPEKF